MGENVSLSGDGSTDLETPGNLTYAWDFGDGGTTNDATGKNVQHAYLDPGVYKAKLTVTDPDGLSGSATATVTVTLPAGSVKPVAVIKVKPKRPGVDRKVRFVGKKSTGTGTLTYAWNFHNGGKKVDATGKKVKTFVRRVGMHKVTLTVTDSTGATAKKTVSYRVRHHYSNRDTTRTVSPDLFRGLISLW